MTHPCYVASSEPTYRVFHLSEHGRVFSAEIISAATDDDARAIAQALPSGHGIELWERARCLGRYPRPKNVGA